MKIKQVMQNILLMLIAVTFALGIAELFIRTIKPVYDFRDRSLLFSSPTFKLYSGGSVRYLPNEKIREIAIYNGTIEYDVLYSTNNFGFVDSKNYGSEFISGKRYYALVGDSFTTGVNGGRPWVPTLRNNKLNAEVYNFGVAATGFQHFYKLLHEMKNKVKITNIVIIAITDDFFRGYWHPVIRGGIISLCSENGIHTTCQPVPIASVIPLNATESQVKEISKKGYKEIRSTISELNAASGLRSRIESMLYDDSAIYYYSKVFLETYTRKYQPSNIEDAIGFIREIRNEFPLVEMNLIHLPQKYEVATRKYNINIADQIKELGINYYSALDKCNWSGDMFFPRDGHPNKNGYENISRCVSGYLFNNDESTAHDSQKQ
jgi:hypothetical protein